MMYLDISVKSFGSAFTIRAKSCGVKTAIITKVPKMDLTTIRLLGTTDQLVEFLHTRFAAPVVQMHAKAIREATPQIANPIAPKNQGLRENRLGVTL